MSRPVCRDIALLLLPASATVAAGQRPEPADGVMTTTRGALDRPPTVSVWRASTAGAHNGVPRQHGVRRRIDPIDRPRRVQATFFPIKKKLELYGVTSRIFGDADAGFRKAASSPAARTTTGSTAGTCGSGTSIRSPVSNVFGFYVGGQNGPTVSVATSFYF